VFTHVFLNKTNLRFSEKISFIQKYSLFIAVYLDKNVTKNSNARSREGNAYADRSQISESVSRTCSKIETHRSVVERIFVIAKFAGIVASYPEIVKCARKNENPRYLSQVFLDSTDSHVGARTLSIVTAGINPEELL
jgi:hypothetical protein